MVCFDGVLFVVCCLLLEVIFCVFICISGLIFCRLVMIMWLLDFRLLVISYLLLIVWEVVIWWILILLFFFIIMMLVLLCGVWVIFCCGISRVLGLIFFFRWVWMNIFGSRVWFGFGKIVCSVIELVVWLMVIFENFSVLDCGYLRLLLVISFIFVLLFFCFRWLLVSFCFRCRKLLFDWVMLI